MAKRKISELADARSRKTRKTASHDERGNKKLIDDANALPVEEFKQQYVDEEVLYFTAGPATGEHLTIDLTPSSELTNEELETCFRLLESTSKPDYEASSWGWHPKQKKREMKDADMRYLLIRDLGVPPNIRPNNGDTPISGFLSFMLTHDEDSRPNVPVLYVYEIHLSASLRRLGLGKHLMRLVEGIAAAVGVRKVMLTCYVSNERAHGFYRGQGYVMDECSPEDRRIRNKIVKADYVILSKAMQRKRGGSG